MHEDERAAIPDRLGARSKWASAGNWLAFLLYNMAEVYAKTQRIDRVESLLREALQIFQKLAQNNPKLYEKHIEQIKAALEE